MSRRVLITGASGFVGRALVAALADAGHHVRAATRDPRRVDFAEGVEVVQSGDYLGPIEWSPMLDGVDDVVHLAGIAHIGKGVDASTYDRVIRGATAELAEACVRSSVRHLVLMSSIRAQCGPAAQAVLTERDTPHPTEPYGWAKLAAEAVVMAAAVPATVLRPTLVYGPHARGNVATLLRLADTPLPLPFAGLEARRSLLALDNLISAVAFVLASDRAKGETYIVADDEAVSVPEMIGALRRGLGRPRCLFPMPSALLSLMARTAGGADFNARIAGSLVVDTSKLRGAGWCAKRGTLDTLEQLARAKRAGEH